LLVSRRTSSFLILAILFWTARLWAALSANEIDRRAEEARGPDGDISFRVEVKDFNGTSLLHETTYKVTSKGGKFVLIETEQPERLQGRKLLMRDDDLWLYLPSIKRPTRVSLQQKLTGEVSNGDLAKTSFRDDYTARLQGEEGKSGTRMYKLMLTAKHKNTTYRKVRLWVDTKLFRPIRAEFFAISGKRLKVSDYSDFQPVLGKDRLTRTTIRDALQPSRQSRLRFYDYRRENLDESLFTKESLP
jgi:outer membrane lipoprotein-sorting protein